MSFSKLQHTKRNLSGGGMVLVLDTGAMIGPQEEAMIQALHSRSIGGVSRHLEVLSEKGAEKFMASFYVGYGHKSIGDCGSTTMFIEGVSMLAAKAIQDSALYSGQEASTRYIDFSKQPFINPIGTDEANDILESWRTFYLSSMEPLIADLKRRFPIGENEKETIYNKAINARAFDILRGFLPAGASTNLAWHGNLRQIADKLALLRHHPLEEVKEIAEKLTEALQEAHPSSFGHERFENTEKYNAEWMQNDYYFDGDKYPETILLRNGIDTAQLQKYSHILSKRPMKTELPKFVADTGTAQFGFMLDFGSFRDIQRHRAIIQRMPLVTSKHGFGSWYLEELPESLRAMADKVLKDQEASIAKLGASPELTQYYTAMGYELPNRISGDLPALVYLVELRATRFVHPTLRKRAIEIAQLVEKNYGDCGVTVHLDADPDRFDVRRGEHDIVQK